MRSVRVWVALGLIITGLSAAPALAADAVPPVVQTELKVPVAQVGSGNYRKLGFKIYRATLWAPDGKWDAAKPYALELVYARDLDKDTVVSSVVDDIRDQKVTDDATFAKWQKVLEDTLPAVKEGDTIIGLAVPGQNSQLFFNGTKIASIEDPVFSKAFFNIWLGDSANETLRAKLLGQDK